MVGKVSRTRDAFARKKTTELVLQFYRYDEMYFLDFFM